jgi:hypothetical protein
MYTQTNNRLQKNKQYKYILSNRDIFDSAFQKINAETNSSSVIIPHVCNNIDQFGSGFTSAIANKFPEVKVNYHLLGKKFLKENPGYCQIVKVYQGSKTKNILYIANMIAQNGVISRENPRPLNYFSLAKSMGLVCSFIKSKINNSNDNTEKIEIHCPKFGSGLAGGNWYFISDLIEDIWSDLCVTVHTIENNKI